jgi:hypothetical protein
VPKAGFRKSRAQIKISKILQLVKIFFVRYFGYKQIIKKIELNKNLKSFEKLTKHSKILSQEISSVCSDTHHYQIQGGNY